MAQKKPIPERTLVGTRHQIFNRLCAAYRRSKDPGSYALMI